MTDVATESPDIAEALAARAIMPGQKWQARSNHAVYKVVKIDRRAGMVHLSSTGDVRVVTPSTLRKQYDLVEVDRG